jgi:hypothetical protein
VVRLTEADRGETSPNDRRLPALPYASVPRSPRCGWGRVLWALFLACCDGIFVFVWWQIPRTTAFNDFGRWLQFVAGVTACVELGGAYLSRRVFLTPDASDGWTWPLRLFYIANILFAFLVAWLELSGGA